jgi:hypothetical protein
MKAAHAPVPVISKSRLEFLFDGVFAIAMTILVLELKVPELVNPRSVAELARALVHEASTFVSYLISFVVLGVFWYRHNQQYHSYHAISRGMLVLHFVQLAAAAFFRSAPPSSGGIRRTRSLRSSTLAASSSTRGPHSPTGWWPRDLDRSPPS